MNQARYQKLLREKARRDKAEAKRERREARLASAATAGEVQAVVSQPEVLAELAVLHDNFRDGVVDFEEFERRKHELMALLDG